MIVPPSQHRHPLYAGGGPPRARRCRVVLHPCRHRRAKARDGALNLFRADDGRIVLQRQRAGREGHFRFAGAFQPRHRLLQIRSARRAVQVGKQDRLFSHVGPSSWLHRTGGGGTDALTRVKTAQLPAGAACGGLEALRCWRSSRRRLLKTTSTVLPSWPTTPAASTRPRVSTSRTSTTMTPSDRARFWYTMERVRRLRATAWLSLAKSLVMSTTSA